MVVPRGAPKELETTLGRSAKKAHNLAARWEQIWRCLLDLRWGFLSGKVEAYGLVVQWALRVVFPLAREMEGLQLGSQLDVRWEAGSAPANWLAVALASYSGCALEVVWVPRLAAVSPWAVATARGGASR